ncbi:MAG TPA: hypothetical protein VJ251_01215, partial [Stellaceae bacterium]|nr:hypothetical protein [Stellaceae bacterium]
MAVRIIVSPLHRRRNKRRPDGCLRERKPRIPTSLRWNVFAGLPSLPVDQFTTDFDRKAAGFSPDRVDALVWAMSDLLVEPMPNEGHFEYMRQRAAALKKP